MIKDLLQERILILDGAMGTMIQQYKLQENDFRADPRLTDWHIPLKGNNDLLSITQPQIIKEIHRQYLEAGADIICTNTFSSTSIAMGDYEMEEFAYELNEQSAIIAREVADEFKKKTPTKPRFVAGAIGPTNRTASLSPDVMRPEYRAVTFDELRLSYAEQTRGLIAGGVDIILVETIFDTLNAKAALFAVQEVFDEVEKEVPIMVSGTITDASGRTLSGQTVEAFLISISHVPLLSIGLNCALGAAELRPYLQRLSIAASPFAISAYPNAGLPNAFGEYDQTAEEMVTELKKFLDKDILNIVGGCCGTTPEHISLLADLAQSYSPRKLQPSS